MVFIGNLSIYCIRSKLKNIFDEILLTEEDWENKDLQK